MHDPQGAFPCRPHNDFAARRHATAGGAAQLKRLLVELYHEIVAHRALVLQAEDVPVEDVRVTRQVIVHRTRRSHRETGIVLPQVLALGIGIRGRIIRDPPQPHLLDHAVLLDPIAALDAPLGLRRARCDDLDPQLRAHAPELGMARSSAQCLLRRRLTFVDALPIRVKRPRHTVHPDPPLEHIRRCPRRFLLAEAHEGGARSIIDHVHDAAAPPLSIAPPLVPIMKTAIHLHEFAEVRAPPTALRPRLDPSHATPQLSSSHPRP
jgi:hypothetical protein